MNDNVEAWIIVEILEGMEIMTVNQSEVRPTFSF